MKKRLLISSYILIAIFFYFVGVSSSDNLKKQLDNKDKSLQTYISISDGLNNVNNKLYANSEQAYKISGDCVIHWSTCNIQQAGSELKNLNDGSVILLSIKKVLVKLEAKYPHDPNLVGKDKGNFL